MSSFISQYIQENTVFGSMLVLNNAMKNCSDRCQKSLKNGPDYASQVSVCTSKCKINVLRTMLIRLHAAKRSGAPGVDAKIQNIQLRLNKEIEKAKHYRVGLKKRETTVPVNQSLKPSPERYDPKKIG